MTQIMTDEQTRDELALAVAELWTKQNGWIPGAAINELEAVLGLPLPTPSICYFKDGDGNAVTYNMTPPRRGPGETYTQWRARQGS